MTTRILMIGAGGIGCPIGLALATANARGELPRAELLIVDDDVVEPENLHRQILYHDGDVGAPKATTLANRLREIAPALEARARCDRLLPDTALELAASADVLVDASDNFATRFLAADAAHLTRRPLVSAASVRWFATVFSSAPGGPCYRCVFEDLPDGDAPDCATAGIIGPVCGVAGAIAADLLIGLARGDRRAENVFSYDGRTDTLRAIAARARSSCPLCGANATITGIDAARYVAPSCDAASVGAP